VTSEVGVGGDLRTSLAAVTPEGPPWYRLVKQAPAISYGAHANELLVTARRTPEAPEGDQVLVLLELPEFELQGTSRWETLGMRGTCSPGFRLSARHTLDQILPVAFAEIASETMVPVSHILWSACWVGIATDAVRRARAFVRAEARGHPGSIPASVQKLAEMSTLLQTMRSTVDASAAEYQRLTIGADEDCRTSLNSVGFAISANNLKLAASELVVEIVMKALSTCGIAGYKIDSPYSVERHLRDALSAGLMIGNDRLRSANAALLLVQKEV
jgi:acyl-CoA dehydrogenase